MSIYTLAIRNLKARYSLHGSQVGPRLVTVEPCLCDTLGVDGIKKETTRECKFLSLTPYNNTYQSIEVY